MAPSQRRLRQGDPDILILSNVGTQSMGNAGATSKASRKNQTTIPARVRKALKVAKGDTLLWTINGDEVSIRILNKVDINWKKTSDLSLLEWTSEESKKEEEVGV